jgi:hypothetical protein
VKIGLLNKKNKQLKIIEKMDNSSDHRKNIYAIFSVVMAFIASTLLNGSSEDKSVTSIFFISFLISINIIPDKPIKAVEQSNTA